MKKEMELKIEKNIPIPVGIKNSSWPFGQMKVGDSFEFPESDILKVTAAMCWYGKRNKMKFSRRKNRVWRVA